MLYFSVSACVTIKPARIVKTHAFGFPEYKSYSYTGFEYRPSFKMQISSNDEILLSFFQRAPADKIMPKASGISFVALLISKEDGELIGKIERPIDGNPDWLELQRYYYGIYPLPDGCYVGLFNRNLQVFDSLFNIIHEKTLDRLPGGYRYDIFTPLQGPFFALQQGAECEIIDYATFKTVDKFDISKIRIRDIMGDKLLIRYDDSDNNVRYLFEKKIGEEDSSDDVYLKINNLSGEKFNYNGSITVLSGPARGQYWFTMENGETGNPVFIPSALGIGGPDPARRAPVVAISVYADRGWDLGNTSWVEVYEVTTGQKLLHTGKYNDGFSYALSSDGRTLAVFMERKGEIELYEIPAPANP